MEIFQTYVESPEITEFNNHQENNDGVIYVKDSVVVQPQTLNLDWLFQNVANNRIASLSTANITHKGMEGL